MCDFSRCGLNVRLDARMFKPCSEATNMLYLSFRRLSLAAANYYLERNYYAK